MLSAKPDIDPIDERPDAAAVFCSAKMCSNLSRTEAKRIVARCHLAFAERGDLLWSAGSDSRFFAIVGKGIVKLARKAPQGRDVVVEVLGPGGCAGVLATLAGSTYPLTATAVTNVWYLKAPRELWRELADSNPEFREQALAELGGRLLVGFDFLSSLLAGDVEQRLATAVLRVHQLLGGSEHLPVTRQHLAEIACVTVESAIRVTSKWQRKGWLRSGYRSIDLLDVEAIAAIVRQSGLIRA